VIIGTKAKSNAHVQELFKLKDPQGRTLLHVAVEEDGFHHEDLDTNMAHVVKRALEILEKRLDDDECVKNCVNAQDSAGRTPLHRAVANKHAGPEIIRTLVDHRMTAVNALWKGRDETVTGNVTALHLAVLHNNLDAAKVLLEKEETRGDLKCKLVIEGSGIPDQNSTEPKLSESGWTALELATTMGQVHMVGTLLEVCS
jgi:ankyrin repeat protein